MLQQQLKAQALKTLEAIEHGSLTLTLPDGSIHRGEGMNDGPHADLVVHDWRALTSMLFHGDIGFAESYRDGLCETPDLIALVAFTLKNEEAMNGFLHGSFWGRVIAFMGNLMRRNTLNGSRRNIHAHYDLGNAFYRLWLDPTMTYSSALFSTPEEDLVSAQHRKYDRILERTNLSTGSILEVGCGWGGFAERALEKGDYAIKGITLSTEQKAYAQKRLGSNAQIVLEDYRLQTGKYDALVSIEMFEAVGEAFWPTYFGKMASLLQAKGRAVIQTITIDEAHFDRYRKSGDFIRSFIFPGGMLPSPTRFTQEAQKAGLKLTDQLAFGQDYAETLKRWLNTFDNRRHEVIALGYDTGFIRMWRLYLAACAAAFAVGRTNVMQMELAHA